MLISRVPDNDGAGEGREGGEAVQDHSHEYQTASELFELMAKNQNFSSSDMESLSTRDLVLLYKNIDLGTKLMSDANEFKLRKPNQYVETVIYNDDPESDGSDLSEINSYEDLHNVVLVNRERLDLINSEPSFENTLCHKFGDLEIQSSDLNTEYDKHFLFKDPYIKEQLKSLNLITNSNEFESTVLPASLLDYICCKRLEDNYNFYMDNIIRYVKHTIEQLKRISNGDYLTDKAKEKWREVENNKDIDDNSNTKILATSTSIPLHVERKSRGLLSMWDDLVHSEVDVRSLSKILEKKIILEVPKLICGSYKLLSKCCAENVIISCQKEKLPIEKASGESRVNVVFQLKRSESGQVMSNISSIMILQSTATAQSDSLVPESLPLTYDVPMKRNFFPESNVKIVELDENVHINPETPKKEFVLNFKDYNTSDDIGTDDSLQDSFDYPCSEYGNISMNDPSCHDSSVCSYGIRDIIERKVNENSAEFNIVSPDELRITMQRLNMQSSLPEESGEDQPPTAQKKKSPTRVRIKSPYENKSHIIEEKKRRKLLEIRDRREKKKMALAENCKISKHKYGKNAIMPQPSSSVTKLSITNKSFYNSIYGQSANFDAQGKGKQRKGMKKDVTDAETGDTGAEVETPMTPDQNNKKYANRSYYLDDTVTEMMYMEMKQSEKKEGTFSASTSEVSNDFRANLNLLSQLIGPSVTDFDIKHNEAKDDVKSDRMMEINDIEDKNSNNARELSASQSINNITPLTTPVAIIHDKIDPKKSSSSVECRRSIDKIYDLMKKFVNHDEPETISSKLKSATINIEKFNITGGRGSSTIQGSDSGTSLKHHLTSSNPSCFSFERNNPEVVASNTQTKQTVTPMAVVPKVIISSKSQIPKIENKKDHKKNVMNTSIKIQDNPLQAISQLLHEFENVQKIRQKSAVEQNPKKPEAIVSTEPKIGSRQNSTKRRSRLDQHIKESAMQFDRVPKIKPPQKKLRPLVELPKNLQQPTPIEDKHVDKINKKKIVDIIDEVKEARGEAVRGPSKINSRLNSLAQPKKSYVQAHSEEYQFKYGRNLMADRLQRLAASSPPAALDKNTPPVIPRIKVKRPGLEPASTVSAKLPSSPVPPLDIGARFRRSTSSGPGEKSAVSPGRAPSSKQNNVLETPETLKKKMVAVETYVKSHYGTLPGAIAVSGPLQRMQMSRVPLLPVDLELASLTDSRSPIDEEAAEIGSKLHRIIDTMINTAPRSMGVLAECKESISKMKDTDNNSFTDNLSRCDEHVSTDSEYNVDIFEDKNVETAVENVTKKEKNFEEVGEGHVLEYEMETTNSTTQLETLESALYHRISVGTFHKRLRIKKLTLTPKQSMQQVVLLQSGDANSLLIKSTLSQNFKISTTTTEHLQHLKALPVLSKTQLDWSFAKFPMQVATVGYAIPQYKSDQFRTKPLKLVDTSQTLSKNKLSLEYHQNNKDSQCFKGAHRNTFQQVAQTDDQKEIKLFELTNISEPISDKPTKAKVEITEEEDFKPPEVHYNEQIERKKLKTRSDDQTPQSDQTEDTINTSPNSEIIDYTTSLDVLVGLLNEITKITTCQTHMTTSNELNTDSANCKELETILNNAGALENSVRSSPQHVISISSLDNLRQLESSPSIYSFYLSENEDQGRSLSTINLHPEIPRKTNDLPKPICVDKQVAADIIKETELVNTLTSVPSKFLPIAVNHSTNVTSSLIGVISEPSTQSLFSFTEYHRVYSKTSTLSSRKNIIKLKQIKSAVNMPANISKDNVELENVSVQEILPKKSEIIIQNMNIQKIKKKLKDSRHHKHCLLSSDFDPMIKMKRDVLVTVYSLLVVTVFAALTFPEILYHF